MSFDKIKKNFGFGCMRLKMDGDKVDYPEFCKMIDTFLEAGFNYFDTAHCYIDGKSETALRDCLCARHSHDEFVLANKLSPWDFEDEKGVLANFENQLALCGVDYFDFYLFHTLNRFNYDKFKSCNCFEIVKELKKQGKVKVIAMSFHDTADILDKILTENPFIEAVQLQINYLDYDDPGNQSNACYEVAVRHGKKVIVMEPVRGGALVNLPPKAAKLFDDLGGGSYASYALRYAASYPEVFMVLSGMGTMEMMQDNINTFSPFVPFNEEEYKAADKAREYIRESVQIKCTKCNYCTAVCPVNIPIPGMFEAFNEHLCAKVTLPEAIAKMPENASLAKECLKCGKCEEACPQKIEIPKHLETIAKHIK